jgi:hypothetical protein
MLPRTWGLLTATLHHQSLGFGGSPMFVAFVRWIVDAPLRRRARNLQVGLRLARNLLEAVPELRKEEAKTIAAALYAAAQQKPLEGAHGPSELIGLYLASLESAERWAIVNPSAISPSRSKAVADFVVHAAFELGDLSREAQNESTRLTLAEIFLEACAILGDLVARPDQPAAIPAKTQEGGADGKLRILLVHGTWGRGLFPRLRHALRMSGMWFDERSRFCEALRSWVILPVEFSAFRWSGSNSARARNKAALELSRVVEERMSRNPFDQHAIVCHSHGGNVALQAMHYLGQPSSRILLITLATPFLQIFQNDVGLRFRWISSLTYLMLAVFMSHVLYLGIPKIADPIGTIAAIVFGLLIICCCYRSAKIFFEIICDLKRSGPIINVLQERTNYTINSQQKILTVRGVSDEASLSLAVGSAIGALSRFLSMILTRFGLFLLSVGSGSLLGAYIFASSDFGINEFVLGGYAWSAVLLLMMLVLRAVAALGRLIFGREMFNLTEGYELDASDSPDSDKNLRIVTAAPEFSGKGMRHGLYYNTYAVQEMARWLFVNSGGGGDYDAAVSRRMMESVADAMALEHKARAEI